VPEYKKRVLIVDDDKAIRTVCRYAIKDMFDEVDEAGSSEDAMVAFRGKNYDIVLLDVMLPGMSGDEYVKQLKKEYPSTDVIMMTATPVLNVAVETMKSGAFDYITKPFKVDNLRDVIEKAISHQEVRQAERLENEWIMRQVQSIAHIGSWNMDLEKNSTEFTDELYVIFGVDREFDCSVKKVINELAHSGDREKVLSALDKAVAGEEPPPMEWRIIRPDGEERVLFSPGLKIIYGSAGKTRKIIMPVQDITARKKTEEQLKKSLDESKLLMREIQHRVKNNLNVILNFLDMQSKNADAPKVSEVLTECKNRINVMAVIHSQLYRSSDIANINMREFAEELLDNLTRHYTSGQIKLSYSIDMGELMIPIASSTPCGLIINELVVNSIKHAFAGRSEGKIKVSMKESPAGSIELTVSDDGIGMPPGLDISKCKSMGLKLVEILSEIQLQGSYEIKTGAMGTTFIIRFKKEA